MSSPLDLATTPEAFGSALKDIRARQGVSLASIAAQTKIAESHLSALERGDLRHWPKGIFRRSYFRDYARAIGIPVDASLDTFRRFFPDGTEEPVPGAPLAQAASAAEPAPIAAKPTLKAVPSRVPDTDEMRLILETGIAPPNALWRRMVIAVADSLIAAAMRLKAMAGVYGGTAHPRSATGGAPPAAAVSHLPGESGWVSDARRIPNAQPQMRVRMRVVR